MGAVIVIFVSLDMTGVIYSLVTSLLPLLLIPAQRNPRPFLGGGLDGRAI